MSDRRSLLKAGSALAGAGFTGLFAQQIGTRQQAVQPTHLAFNVLDFGAVPDGRTLNTSAFERALRACAAAGGGIVHVPPGKYLTGSIRLGSNMVLNLAAGAVLKGSPKLEDYAVPGGYPQGSPASVPAAVQILPQDVEGGIPDRGGVVIVRNAENIAITGRGTIDGNGLAFQTGQRQPPDILADKKFTRQKEEYGDPKYGTEDDPLLPGRRPGGLIEFVNCRNVRLEGITAQNSPVYTVHFVRCEDVDIHGVNINSDESRCRVGNDDGVNFHECVNFRMSNCNIRTGDDCIAAFGSRNVVVSNCNLSSRSSAVRVGYAGGDMSNCVFENLTIDSTNCGIKVDVRAGGVVEDILFSNIVMRTSLMTGDWWGRGEPIHVSAVPMLEHGGLGRIRRIRFTNILAQSENSMLFYGSPDSLIEDVLLENVELRMRNSKLQTSYGGNFDLRRVADFSKALFEHDVPGLFFRHVEGLRIRGFRVAWDEQIPEFFSYGIEGEEFRDVEIQAFEGRQARAGEGTAISLRNGRGITIRDCRAAEGTDTFLSQTSVAGQRLFANNDLGEARHAFEPSGHGFTAFGNLMPSGHQAG